MPAPRFDIQRVPGTYGPVAEKIATECWQFKDEAFARRLAREIRQIIAKEITCADI